MEQSKRKIIVSLSIIFLMISSAAGFILSYSSSNNNGNSITEKYNGYEFTRLQTGWVTNLNNQQIFLYNDPEFLSQSEAITKDEYRLNTAEKVYLSINPDDKIDRVLSHFNDLAVLLKPRISLSCYEDSEKCKTFTIRTCENASPINKVIIIKKQQNLSINYSNNCLKVYGSENEMIKFIDKMILSLLPNGE